MDGTILNPNYNKQYVVYFNEPGFDETFLETRKTELEKFKTLQEEQNNKSMFSFKDESINDVFLQYMGYFRNK